MRNIRPIIRLASLLAICGLLVLAGCQNPTQPSFVATEDGTLLLTIETQSTERAIMPTITMEHFSRIRLDFAESANTANTLYRIWDNAPVTLPAGTWNMRATAYLDDAGTVEAARSVWIQAIAVAPGQTATLNETVMLLPIAEGQGTFRWNIGFPASAVHAEMEVRKIDGNGNESETPYWYDDFDLTASGLGGTLIGYESLTAGTYRVFLTLTNAQDETFTVRSVLHVWQNMESVFTEEFTPGIFPVSLFAYVMQAWSGTEWDFTVPEIQAGDFLTLLDVDGVDTDNFHADNDTGVIYWLNTLTYNDGVPADMDDFRALVDAALIGIRADAAFRAEDSHASRQALEQAARAFALNESSVWFYWPANNRVIAHVGDNAGTYYSIEILLAETWRIPLTVTFNSAGGTLVSSQDVREGNPVSEPGDPIKTLIPTAGLWVGTLPLVETPLAFERWECEDGDLWNFDTPVTENITLTARWSAAPATRVEGVAANNLTAAVAHVDANPGTFTLAIDDDIPTTPASTLNAAGVDLTIVGLGEPREIRASNNRIFTVGITAEEDGSPIYLTLGNNITLVGRAEGNHASMDLVRVRNHGHLIMEGNSKITGHVNGGNTVGNGWGAAVNIEAHGTLTMRGGEITGNRALNAGTDIAAGVSAAQPTSSLIMEGGRIHGNTRGANVLADVRIYQGAVSLSGDAELYRVILVNHAYSSIAIGADWDGEIGHLDLRGSGGNTQAALDEVIANWTGSAVLRAAEDGQTLRPEDVASIASVARFITGNEARTQPVTAAHEITNAGVVRQIVFTVTFYSAGGTPIQAQPGIAEDTLATRPTDDPIRVSTEHDIIDGTRINEAGLWAMTYGFVDWRRRVGDELQEWNFATPITEDTTLVAVWDTADLTPARIDAVAVDAAVVANAVAHVNANPGRYTLAIGQDVPASRNQLDTDGAHLTIIGFDGRRTITFTDDANNQRLFDIGATAVRDANGSTSLTLGNDITLVGRDNNDHALIRVRDNASLYMEHGAEIRGHTNASPTLIGQGSAVHVAAHGTFTMRGGTITDNRASAVDTSIAGGVFVAANGHFLMKGGSIFGNTRYRYTNTPTPTPADIFVSTGAARNLTVSGTAEIYHITLSAAGGAGGTNHSCITVESGWDGEIFHLYLRQNSDDATAVAANWTNRRPIRAAGTGTLTDEELGRIGSDSVRFIGDAEDVTQDIDDARRRLVNDGNTAVVREIFTVTFYSACGTQINPQIVIAGNLATTPPALPTRAWSPSAGLWSGSSLPSPGAYAFDGWWHGNAEAEWNFQTNTVTGDITLTARWTAPATPVAGVPPNDVFSAVFHVNTNAPGTFTLAIDRDVTSTNNFLTEAGAHLVIVGLGTERRIEFEPNVSTQTLFEVGPASGSRHVSLTLDNNITLVGREHGTDLVRVQNGGNLIMEGNSRITGHINTGGGIPNAFGAAVSVGVNGTLTMRSGTITGNRAGATAAGINLNTLAGGVFVGADTSTVNMTGGSITGNYRGATGNVASDVRLAADVNRPGGFALSGNATVGSLILFATSMPQGPQRQNSIITIGASWSGHVAVLYLATPIPVGPTLGAVADRWTNYRVLQAASGRSLSSSDLTNIRAARFMYQLSGSPPTQTLAEAGRRIAEGTGGLAAYVRTN